MSFHPVPFRECTEEENFGGKVTSLGAALRAGLPAPPGYGVEVELVNAVVAGNEAAIAAVKSVFDELAPSMAVRSSAVGEDSADASFAGQHDSIMNVRVYQSGHTESALAYREKVGVTHDARIAVAIQQQIPSEKAGVMFTRNPITGNEERYIEVAWGLGEAVVAGMVVPDTFRIGSDGSILEKEIGEKDVQLILSDGGGTDEVEVAGDLIEAACLNDEELQQMHQLALDCEAAYGPNLDMEFAFYRGKLYLLQCRTITTVHKL
jgi:pyruvate,water dikinase